MDKIPSVNFVCCDMIKHIEQSNFNEKHAI